MSDSAKNKKKKQNLPYGFLPSVEQNIVCWVASDPSVMKRVGYALDPDLLALPETKLIATAALKLYRETGSAATEIPLIVNELKRSKLAGKLKEDDLWACIDLLSAFETKTLVGGRSSANEAVYMLAELLKSRKVQELASSAIDAIQTQDIERIELQISEFKKLGMSDPEHTGIDGLSNLAARLEEAGNIVRIPCGITALDAFFHGGFPDQTITTFMAHTGGGKSMALSHILAYATHLDEFTAYISLELPEHIIAARAIACRTGIPVSQIISGERQAEAFSKLEGRFSCVIDYFPAKETSMADIAAWVEQKEELFGRRIKRLIIDYADLLSPSGKRTEKDVASSYSSMGAVYTEFRNYIREKRISGYTASQSRGREDHDGKKKLDLQHASDSTNKARLADQFITMNVDHDTGLIEYFVAKARYQEGRKSADLTPFDFSLGRAGLWAPELAAAPPLRREKASIQGNSPTSTSLLFAESEVPF